MASGNPVVINETEEGHRFEPLIAISTRGDSPESFQESLLQALIAECPDVLPIRDFLPSSAAAVSLGREIPVDIGGNGYIDNLLVTNDGYLVVVETKLYRNPEAIRDVVTQTLQYGMAIGNMTLLELESRIRQGMRPANLQREESIPQYVYRLASARALKAIPIADDFEEALERHFRRGEILLLVVSDAIRIGVERVTRWLNEQGNSSPFKFGLVELKFHSNGGMRVVVPRAVLKTQEISRHVVVVDIPTVTQGISATVIDEYRAVSGSKIQESRSIKPTVTPLTKTGLLQMLSTDDRPAATKIIEKVEAYGFDFEGTPSTLKFGFTDPDGVFRSLGNFDRSGIWVYPQKRDRIQLGGDGITEFQNAINRIGRFYRADQIGNIDSNGCAGRYRDIEEKADEFAALLDLYRGKLNDQPS